MQSPRAYTRCIFRANLSRATSSPTLIQKVFFYPFYVQREMYTIPENNTLFETIRDTVPVFVTAKCYTAINCVSNLFSLIPGVMCMLSFRIFPDRSRVIKYYRLFFENKKYYVYSLHTCTSLE